MSKGRLTKRMLEIVKMFDCHTSTKLSVTIEFKTFCQSELACPELVEGKTDEGKLEIVRMLIVTLRLAQCDKGFKTQCQSELVED